MFDFLKQIIEPGKDVILSQLAKLLANQLGLEPYGELKDLAIDTKAKQIKFNLLLKGEAEPLRGMVNYHIENVDGQMIVVADSADFSREWINVAFERLVDPDKRRFPIPSNMQPMVKLAGI